MHDFCFRNLSPAKRLLIQQVDFVNSRHFFQHQSRAKHWFKNLKILMTSKFQLNIFSFLFSGFYLFLQVHFTSLHSQNVKLRHYLCIGWGELNFFSFFFFPLFFSQTQRGGLLWKSTQPLNTRALLIQLKRTGWLALQYTLLGSGSEWPKDLSLLLTMVWFSKKDENWNIKEKIISWGRFLKKSHLFTFIHLDKHLGTL